MPHHLGPVATGQRNPRIAAEFLKHEPAQLEHPRRDQVQRQLENGLRRPPSASGTGMFRIDFDDPEIDWRLLGGDAELAPGITATRAVVRR